MRLITITAFVAVLSVGAVHAQTDQYQITEAEKAACSSDAIRLCSAAYPDESALLACLKQNRGSLSATCAAVLKAGLKKRGMR